MRNFNRQIIAIISVVAIFGSCTPDSKELKVLNEEKVTLPKNQNTQNPPLDLSHTIVDLNQTQKSVQIFRDPQTKLLRQEDNHTFTFTPKFSKRKLADGEEVILKIVSEESSTERTLPAESYTIIRDQVSSTETNGSFSFELKKDAFTEIELNQEYVIMFQAQILTKTPEDLSVKTKNDEPLYYKMKVIFIGESFPQDNNVEVVAKRFSGNAISTSKFFFESDYKSDHLHKLTDEGTYQNWWVSTENPATYLKANFAEVTRVQGVRFILKNRNKTLGGVKVYASPDGQKEYYQGQYILSGSHKENVYISFTQPIDVKTIKFIEFKKFNNNTVDIHEIEFY